MDVCLTCASPWLLPWDKRELIAGIQKMSLCLKELPSAPQYVELHIVHDARMAEENMRTLQCQGTTNILAFPVVMGSHGILMLSIDAVHRECLLYAQEPKEYILRLLAHGLCHLCGLDHGAHMDTLTEKMLIATREHSA